MTSRSDVSAGLRKRQRSPGPAYVKDYRPYGGRQLQQIYEKKQLDHRKQWDTYYRNNTINGYKDRQYLLREFVELQEAIQDGTPFSWMEAGCGVGNAMLPVFEQYGGQPNWVSLLGFDISAVAISLLKEKQEKLPEHVRAKMRVCTLDPCEEDIASSSLFSAVAGRAPRVEFVSMVFVLCSIPVASHKAVLRRVAECMVDGGVFFFRDYCVSDHAERRFQNRAVAPLGDEGPGSDAGNNTYTRTNGTLSHFFSLEEVETLFHSVGLEVIELKEVEREVVNRKQDVTLVRKFVQGRFRKQPADS